jgi:hypothetical protein
LLLTLVLVPSMYMIIEKGKNKVNALFGKNENSTVARIRFKRRIPQNILEN